MDKFALRLKALREFQGLSQKKLADKAGISVVTLNKIEKGADTLVSTLTKLDAALGGGLI